MLLTSWIQALVPQFSQRFRKQLSSRRRSQQTLSQVEAFEVRCLLSAITVTSLADDTTVDDQVTLREAIKYANNQAGADTITFAPGLSGTIDLLTALPDLTGEVIIQGPGAGSLTVQRDSNAVDFNVFTASQASASVGISGLTISGGRTSVGGGIYSNGTLSVTDCTISNNYASSGGGIYVGTGSTVTVTNSILSGNSASNGVGGAIDNQGTLTVSGCTFQGNSATSAGCGIYTTGAVTVTVEDSTFRNNSTTAYWSGAAGIQCDGSHLFVTRSVFDSNSAYHVGGIGMGSGTIEVHDTTFMNNRATRNGAALILGGSTGHVYDSIFTNNETTSDPSYSGGAIKVDAFSVLDLTRCTLTGNIGPNGGVANVIHNSTLNVIDSELSGNTATTMGGAILNSWYSTVNVTNSTVANNTGPVGGALYNAYLFGLPAGEMNLTNVTMSGNVGGGVGGTSGTGAITLRNSIIAGNVATSGGVAQDVTSSVSATSSYNLIGTGGSGGLTNTNGNQVGVSNPGLAPLGNYGGSTQTLALLPGSPAINAGNSSAAPATDQRGVSRVGEADIGAFESRGFSAVPSNGNQQQTPINTSFSQPLTVAVSSAYGEPVAGGHVTFTAPAAGASAILSGTTAIIAVDGSASVTAAANETMGSNYNVTASAIGITTPAYFTLTNTETQSLVVTTAGDPGNPFDTLTSLREAIEYANSHPGDDEITFAPSLYAGGLATLALNLGQLGLTDTTGLTRIIGPGADLLNINGNHSSRIFYVAPGANVEINGVTIADSRPVDFGGGIRNYGDLVLNDSIVRNNQAMHGAGIYNEGTVTLTNSSVIGNAAGSQGGGIFSYSTVTITNSVLDGNSAASGGGICSVGPLTITGSTFERNTAESGGAVTSYRAMSLTNSTIGDNSAIYGGGIYQLGNNGSLTVLNSSIVANQADRNGNGGGVGGGILTEGYVSNVFLFNTIVAGNVRGTAGNALPDDLYGVPVEASSAHNLIGDPNSAGGLTDSMLGNIVGQSDGVGGRILLPVNEILNAVLDSYGGSTQTFALLPGSPAIDAGSTSLAPSIDQRGVSRVGAADIGAFESRGFEMTLGGGDHQSTPTNTAFTHPLTVVVSSQYGEPVAGGQVTFTAPASGASAILSAATAIIGVDSHASVTASANAIAGSNYIVTASAAGIPAAASFTLSNSEAPSLVVTTTNDLADAYDGLISLREAIVYANTLSGHHEVAFASGVTGVIDLMSALPVLSGDIALAGPGAASLTVQRDAAASHFSVITVGVNARALISDLTIAGGFSVSGGGVFAASGSTVQVVNSILHGNSADRYGGGIFADGSTLTVTNSTLADNSAGSGGGIYVNPMSNVTVDNSTLTSNSTRGYGGGGIVAELLSVVTVTNSTLAYNSASTYGGGILAHSNSTVTVTNSTLAGNSADFAGGGIYASQSGVTVTKTVVARNTRADHVTPSDVNGILNPTSSYNLIGDGSGGLNPTLHNLLGSTANPLDPSLGPLSDNGGPTQTMALLPGSPAIDAGITGGEPERDQRGVIRGGTPDIGAFESRGFEVTVSSGDNQHTRINTSFAQPLIVTVSSSYGEPVAGGQVTFTAPASGASAILSAATAIIGVDSHASVTASANAIAGSNYMVTASAAGIPAAASFTLSNSEAPSLVVTTTNDLADAYDGLTSLREAVAYANAHPNSTISFAIMGTVQLTQGNLHLTQPMTIAGLGADLLTIDAGHNSRVFYVEDKVVTISGLTLINASAQPSESLRGEGPIGGAIFTWYSTLTLENMAFHNNSSPEGGGVGGFMFSNVTVRDSVFFDNSAPNAGALSAYQGRLAVENSTFTGNSAAGSGGAIGAGLIGELIVTDSTFHQNTASTGDGGAIYGTTTSGIFTVTNSTLSENHANRGGGVYLSSGTKNISNCTIVANTANVGGGARLEFGTSAVNNTIFWSNSAASSSQLNNYFSSLTVTNSLIQGGWAGAGNIDQDPLLAPLGNYGGPTQTMALLPGSPAIDAGITGGVPERDQRGVIRGGTPDIGAFESRGFEATDSSGDDQHTRINTSFAQPLILTVSSSYGEPVAGGQVTFTAPASGASATLSGSAATLGADGQASVTATANGIAGNYVVIGGGRGITGTLQFNLTNVNLAPIAHDGSLMTDEDTPQTGTLMATDVDSPSLTFSIVTNASHGVVVITNIATGAYTYTPTANYHGPDSFTFKANDGNVDSNTATVAITVNSVNDGPTITPQTYSIAENTANGVTVGTVVASDVDAGDTRTFTITSGNSLGAFALSSAGVLTVADATRLNYETNPTFTLTVKVTDAGGLFASSTVTINLTNVNEAPTIAPQTFSVAEGTANGTTVGTVAASDPDAGDTRTFTITSGNSLGAFALSSAGVLTVADSTQLNYETNPTFTLTVQVTDAGGLFASNTVTINLLNVNDPPTMAPQTFSVAEGTANGTTVGTVAASDPDAGDTKTFTITSGNNLGAFALSSAGVLTVADSTQLDFGINPTFTLTVQVTDAGGLFATNTVTIDLLNVNDPPTMAPQTFSVAEGTANGTTVGTVASDDHDAGDTRTFTITSGNSLGAFALSSSGVVTVGDTTKLKLAINPTFTLTVKVTDAGGLFVSNTVTINVTPAPIITPALTGYQLQRGQVQRSFIRYIDLSFSSAAGLDALISSGRVKLTRQDLLATKDAFGVNLLSSTSTNVSLVGALTHGAGSNQLKFDFGANGIGGSANSITGDGYYKLQLDLDGDGVFETTKSFYRLLGDRVGDRSVDQADYNDIQAQIGKPYNAEYDMNGDGRVDSSDLIITLRSKGRKMGNVFLDPNF